MYPISQIRYSEDHDYKSKENNKFQTANELGLKTKWNDGEHTYETWSFSTFKRLVTPKTHPDYKFYLILE